MLLASAKSLGEPPTPVSYAGPRNGVIFVPGFLEPHPLNFHKKTNENKDCTKKRARLSLNQIAEPPEDPKGPSQTSPRELPEDPKECKTVQNFSKYNAHEKCRNSSPLPLEKKVFLSICFIRRN